MVRMRWLALALVCCMATTVRAQNTQDTAKAKPAMTKSGTSQGHGSQVAVEDGADGPQEHDGRRREQDDAHAGSDSRQDDGQGRHQVDRPSRAQDHEGEGETGHHAKKKG